MKKTYTCCMCGEEHTGFGNNPRGALDIDGNWINWEAEDRCCDDCNRDVVIPCRIALMLL